MPGKDKPRLDLITNREFANLLGFCYPWYMKWILRNDIPEGYKVGTYTIWERQVILDYMKSIGRKPSTKKPRA